MNQRRGAEAKPSDAKTTLRSPLFLGLLLVTATVLTYQPVWQAGFIWDDDAYITQNRLLSAPDGLKRIWFSEDSPSQYFPLVYTSFRFEHALWGFNPVGYHWLNILLHALNALLVWRVLERLKVPGAWLAAALFALHPVQVETVAWVTERKNVLSLLFFLLALLAWLRFTQETVRPWRHYILSLAFYLPALLSKTTACTLPAALVLVLWLQKKPINWLRAIQVTPFVAVGLAMGLLTMWWERYHMGTQGGVFSLGLGERLLIASHGFWFYLGKLIWPANLAFSYPRWVLQPGHLLAYGWLFAGLLLCGLVYLLRRRLGRGPETALAFYVATLAPTLGFIMLYTFRYTFVADHYQYVACIGPLALGAAGLRTAWNALARPRAAQSVPAPAAAAGSSRRAADSQRVGNNASGLDWRWVAACMVPLLCVSTLTWRQARIYKNVETLWRDTVAKNPKSWLARSNLGSYLLHNGQIDQGMQQYQEALRINPRDVDSLVSVGNALFGKGRYDEATTYYQQALEINPNSPEAHVNLAVILANQGTIDQAIEHDRQALIGNPNHVTAHSNLAVLLARQGRYAEALEHYEKVLAMNPNQPLIHINLALALNSLGRTNEARAHYLQAAEIVNRYARDLAQQGRLDAATAQYRELLKIVPNSPDAHFGLGLVLEQQGNRAEARAELSEALRLKPNFPEADRELQKLGGIRILKQ